MKYFKIVLIGIGLMAVSTFYACNQDEEFTEEEKLEQARQEVLETMSETPWEPSSIQRDGIEVEGDFDGFQLELKDGTFRTINGGQAWPESGTWQFVEGQSNQLIRDDGVIMDIIVDGEEVEISFTITEEVFTGGRMKTTQTRIAFFLKRLFALFGLG